MCRRFVPMSYLPSRREGRDRAKCARLDTMRRCVFGLVVAVSAVACTTFSADPGPGDSDASATADGSTDLDASPRSDAIPPAEAGVVLPTTYTPDFRCQGLLGQNGVLLCNDFEAADALEAFGGLTRDEQNSSAISLESRSTPPEKHAHAIVPTVSGVAVLKATVSTARRSFRFGVDLRRGAGVSSNRVIELGPVGAPIFVLAVKPTALEVSLGGAKQMQGLDGEWHRFTVTFDGTAMRAAVDGEDFGLESRPGAEPTLEVRVGLPKGTTSVADEATLDIDNLVFKLD